MKRFAIACWVAAVLLSWTWAWAEPGAAPGAVIAEPDGAPRYAPQRRLTGGAIAGLGLADMGGEVEADVFGMQTSPSPQVLEGLSAGGFVALQLHARWGARIELRYTRRGASAAQAADFAAPGDDMSGGDMMGQDEAPAIPYAFDFQLAYLELPLLATCTIPYDGRLVPYVFAGPDLGLLLSAEVAGDVPMIDDQGNVQVDDQGNLRTVRAEKDVKDGVSSFDVGVTLGAGMKFPLGRGRLVLDARYTLGILEAADGGEIALVENLVTLSPRNLRHRVLSLSAAYEF